MRIDLHVHSTASDGAYAPEEVVRMALTHALDVIALTDHDTVAGVAQAQAAGAGTPLRVLAGVELSAEDEGADRHILGYLFNPEDAALKALFTELHAGRERRIEQIVAKLAALGLHIPVEDVLTLADGGSAGRPHVARVLVRYGYAASLQEAFDRYLGDDGPAYVPHYLLRPAAAIDLIHQAGGVAVLAHPGRLGDYHAIVAELVPLGLDGLEVFYPDHSPAIVRDLQVLARRHNLLMTAGSDFHRRDGDGNAALGSVRIPDRLDLVGALHARAAHYVS